METAIRVENLGKKYILRHQVGGRQYVALRDVVAQKFSSLFRRRRGPNPSREEFWALQDVSFEIKQGEAIGIIGRNGAGKSTLLKLLSRIVKPTKGRIEIHGRVASLLEVGTGFHPELTGRENIYLNGAIMGMARTEIRRKFDEIVAFAEVEKFLDTPVKYFSSGMYVRLAFAVAAHLEPEILIVDEVLAVGDLQFQKKCLTKMEDVTGKDGRTVLFVSHNMDLISKLCTKALLLTAGKAGSMAPVEEVTREYLNQTNDVTTDFVSKDPTRALRSVTLDHAALAREQLTIAIRFKYPGRVTDPVFGVGIYTENGSPIAASNTRFHPLDSLPANLREGEAIVTFPKLPFWSERYMISVWVNDGWTVIDQEENAITFEFVSASTPVKTQSVKALGPVYLPASWKVNK
jgi:lipopolysaccharide transport system ATP-binding protein